MYHRRQELIRYGEYCRLASYRENHQFDCWQVAAADGSQALVTFVQVLGRPGNHHSRRIKLQGLRQEGFYREEETQRIYRGDALMYAGLPIREMWGDYRSCLIYLRLVEE